MLRIGLSFLICKDWNVNIVRNSFYSNSAHHIWAWEGWEDTFRGPTDENAIVRVLAVEDIDESGTGPAIVTILSGPQEKDSDDDHNRSNKEQASAY